MKLIDLLLYWSESINSWLNLLKKYIKNNYDIGEELVYDWAKLIKKINNIKMLNIENTNNDSKIVSYINTLENYYNILIEVDTKIIIEDIKILSVLKEDSKTQPLKDASKLYFDKVFEFLKNDWNSIKIDNYSNGYIVSILHIKQLLDKKDFVNVELYKDKLFTYGSVYKFPSNVLPIQKINYLISPFVKADKDKLCSVLSLSTRSIAYNIEPLMYRNDALKYGPIHPTNHGIDNNMINRFKTFSVTHLTNVPSVKISSINDELVVYNGLYNKTHPLIYWEPGSVWEPFNGVSHIVYKYNEILSDKIFSKMKVNSDKYKDFNKFRYPPVRVNKEHARNKNYNNYVSSLCFSTLDERILSNNINDNVKKEIYLMQFFNARDIIFKLKKNSPDELDIIPITFPFSFFNII